MEKRDTLFQDSNAPFQFDGRVADVFDNMLERSVPFYHAIQDIIVQLCHSQIRDHDTIIDFGTSTGTTIKALHNSLQNDTLSYVGIDYSSAMLKKAAEKLDTSSATIQWEEKDLNHPLDLPAHKISICNLVLQFIKVANRLPLLQTIYQNMQKEGMIILVEKIHFDHPDTQNAATQIYENLKAQNGYSQAEITNKKEALKNVLIPQSIAENQALLRAAGFTDCVSVFQWMTFVILIGRKV